jgi:hypothetical protein
MKATQTVRTDVFPEDVMDINEYVRVKKLPCGTCLDSSLVHGVVCTKNVTHKKMCTNISNPTILLLKCAFDFQRRENQLSSFDTLHLQEDKYLQNLVDKVRTFSPKIILVQKSVSRLALQDLHNLNIVVVVNVKPSVMMRVARCTQGEILTSLDQLFFDVRLGTCKNFYLRDFTVESGIKKTLMYFDKCDQKLGCVITLQGGTKRELKKVKKVTQFGLRLAHNALLESSFLLHEHAWPRGYDNELGLSRSSAEDSRYCSCPSTPEFPLYPSLPHPLDALPPIEVVKRLEALGVEMEKSAESSDGEEGEEFLTPEPAEGEGGNDVPPGCGTAIKELPDAIEESAIEGDCTGQDPVNLVANESMSVGGSEEEEEGEEESTTHSHTTMPQPDSAQPDSIPFQSDIEVGTEAIPESTHASPTLVDPASADAERKLKAIEPEVLAQLGEKEFDIALSTQLLSISPNVAFTTPYLQTVQGGEADIRQYLPNVIYWSFQFKPAPRSGKAGKEAGNSLEMGLTKGAVEKVAPPRDTTSKLSRSRSCISCYKPSYKSVSEHPFTSAILLLKANTNEMKAALADFRSRAGLVMEDNDFFFKSAKVAANYRLHLQNVFNRYQQFEWEEEEEEKEEEEEEKDEVDAGEDTIGEEEMGMVSIEVTVVDTTVAGDEMLESGLKSEEKSKSDVTQETTNEKASREGTPSRKERHRSPHLMDSGSSGGGGRWRGTRTGTLEDIDKGSRPVSEEVNPQDLGYDEIWLNTDQQTDCLDPNKHQGISVLFSNTCGDRQKHQQRPCLPPW